MPRRQFVLALFVLLASSCRDSVTAPADDVRLEVTSTPLVRVDGLAEVPFSVTNAGRTEALVARCGERLSVIVERSGPQGWETYYSGLCVAIHASNDVTLPAGATRHDALAIAAAGTYRLMMITRERRVHSAPFVVR